MGARALWRTGAWGVRQGPVLEGWTWQFSPLLGAGGVWRGWGRDPKTTPSWRVYPKGRLIQSPPAQAAIGIFTHTYYTRILTAHPTHIPTWTIAPARTSLLSSPCRPFPDRSLPSPDLPTPFISQTVSCSSPQGTTIPFSEILTASRVPSLSSRPSDPVMGPSLPQGPLKFLSPLPEPSGHHSQGPSPQGGRIV